MGALDQMKYTDMLAEVEKTLEIMFPQMVCQAELFRIKSAEGRTPARQYEHVCNLAHDANLKDLNAEKIKIILTINSLEKSNSRLREKTLEAVGPLDQPLNDALFKKLIAEHESWVNNQTTGTGAKARKVGGL